MEGPLLDPFILDVLGLDEAQFHQESFKPYTIPYGYQNYTADFDKAIGFRSKRWLKLEFDLSSINKLVTESDDIWTYFLQGPNITFYFPISKIRDLKVDQKILHYNLLSKGNFPPSLIQKECGYQFEIHHVMHQEDQLIVLPTDIHGGFSDVLHMLGRKLFNRPRYNCLRPLVIASMGKIGLTNVCERHPEKYPRLKTYLETKGDPINNMFHPLFNKIHATQINLSKHHSSLLYTSKVSFEELRIEDLHKLMN